MADGRDDDTAVNERIRIVVDERIRNTVNERLREDADFLQMHGIENAGMTIVTAPMDGTNYLAWSRAIKLALRVGALYTKTSRELWLDLEERYGESNGPLVYQLQREITSISQGSLSVVEYFTKLKILWDELACLIPTQGCTCGFCICDYGKIAAESNTLNQLMQFLMGLNDTYDHIRSQILVMEPLPSVNKAYSMVQRVEKQRKLNLLTSEIPEGVALNARWSAPRGRDKKHENLRKRDITDKKSQFCSHCDKSGHTRETRFKLHGYLEWYKTMQEQKKGDGRNFNAHMTQDKVTETKSSFNAHMTQDKMTETKSDLRSKAIIGVGRQWGSLYVLDKTSSILPLYISTLKIRSFITNVAAIQEPRSFAQACQDERWKAAMQYELDALERNQTWDLCDLPANKKAIGSRWVYKVKLLPDGSVDRYKARLVAKGYSQIEGVDYFDSFSPVAKTVTVRLFLAIASSYSWPMSQLDVNNAFLHGHLEEEVYMLPPEGYLRARPGQVCRLKRSLYGLKQASRQWNIELTSKLESHGFTRSPHDHCFFTKGNGPSFLALLVYVDDILITGPSLSYIQEIKTYLNHLFTIKDLGFAKYFLGLELSRSPHGTYVNQAKYLHDILVDCKVLDARATATPLPLGIKFDNSTGALLSSPDCYRRLICLLLYLGFSRPDISFAVQQLSQFLQHPRVPHWDVAIYLLRYLKGTPDLGLFFPANTSLQLCAYSDSDWASCPDSRRSLTGYCIFLGVGGLFLR
ncbi:Retrovirus-related Pol polyprotein from transposon RE2 [Sesamum angolense]|uniref:Retrovirus-related Pol polyprotein from transposon RE2 n=1 Tax=Sesamum angolense TaxID=2727404 RepID=A0AAE1WIR9_9LAMI|nr:Retrovirus-related Pol polyprotein from transposon RE2 [Sesamum angolense]